MGKAEGGFTSSRALEAVSQLPLLWETGAHTWARSRGMLLSRQYLFKNINITVESFPLNRTFFPG